MISAPYYTVTTPSGATVETYLDSARGRGFLKISEPISLCELLESDELSSLTIECRGRGLKVKRSEYARIKGKTFVEGTGPWAVGSQEMLCINAHGEPCTAYFQVDAAPDGGVFVTAYAKTNTPGMPPALVQLDVEFD